MCLSAIVIVNDGKDGAFDFKRFKCGVVLQETHTDIQLFQTFKMHPIFALGFSLAMIIYLILQAMLHATQNKREPAMMKSNVPFFDTAIDMFRHRAKYWATLRYVHKSQVGLN